MAKFLHLLLVLLIAAAGVALESSPAHAQDDWSVQRDPFDKGVIRRYKGILSKNPHDAAARKQLSSLYRRYRTIGKLIGEYQADVAKSPTGLADLIVLGYLLSEQSNTAEAIAVWQRAVVQSPNDARLLRALGEEYRTSGDVANARQVLEQAQARTSDRKIRGAILRSLAGLALDKSDIDGAARYFADLIKLEPSNVQVQLEFGDALSNHNRHIEAIGVFKAVEGRLKGDPTRRVEVISRLGDSYERAGKSDEAIREYRRAVKLSGNNSYHRKELTARIIDIYRRRQALDSLVREYEKSWPIRGRDHFEWDTLARLYEEIGVQERAVDAYRKATAKAPYELDTQRRLIKLLENSGRESEAVAQYEKVMRVAPGEPRFQLELAQRYWEQGQQKKAMAMLDKLERRFGSDAGVHSALADLYTRWGREDRALQSYIRLTRIEPGETAHLVNLGEQYFQRGDRKKAVATWKKIINRKTAASFAKLGRVYAEHDMSEDALQMYGKAIKMQSTSADHYRGRATVYERQKRYRDAANDWLKSYDLTPKTPANKPTLVEARRRIVGLFKRDGSLPRHTSKWRTRFRTNKDVEAGYFLVEASLRAGNYPDARNALESLLALNAQDIDAMQLLVKVYRAERRYDKAVALLLVLADKDNLRERDYFNQVAELKTRLNEDKAAIFYAQKALDKSPKDPLAHLQLAQRYLDIQQYEKAIAALEKTVELDQRNFNAYFQLARLYRNTQRLDKAANLYRQILRRASDEDILHKAGHESINLEELTGTLGELERIISPLAFTFGHKAVYRRILVALYDRYVPLLVENSRSGSDADRKSSIGELSRLGSHGLKPLLEALADDRDPIQQRIAVSVLGYLGNKGAAAPLVRIARQAQKKDLAATPLAVLGRKDRDWDLRLAALIAAGRLGDPRTIPDLVELGQHEEAALREAATFALGMTGDRQAIKPLIRALDDKRPSVQTLACVGLAHAGEGRATRSLIAVLTDEQRSDETRAACAFALGVSSDRSATLALSKTVSQGNDEVQRLSAWALGRLADNRAVPALLSAYFGRRKAIRKTVAWALPRAASGTQDKVHVTPFMNYPTRNGKFDGPTSIAQLPGPLAHTNLKASVIVGNEQALIDGLEGALGRHRDLIARVLEDLDSTPDRLSLGPLTHSISKRNAERQAVDQSVRRIAAAIVPKLELLAKHDDTTVRRRSLSVLAKIGTPEVLPILAGSLDSDNLQDRATAMLAIAPFVRRGRPGSKKLVARVKSRLQAEHWRERVAAAEALGSYGRHSDGMALTKALLDPTNKVFVRQAAAHGLGALQFRRGVSALIRASRDPAPAVQAESVRALMAIKGPETQRALAGVARDERVSQAVRVLARDFLDNVKR